jgi:hypothetical protein
MRATVNRLLDPDAVSEALPPAADEVDTLTRMMRGQLALLVPDVEQLMGARRRDAAHYCALACIGEAREKLAAEARPGCSGALAYARRLARALNALCDHYERLSEQS